MALPFLVEDGTGVAGANSYLEPATATAIFAAEYGDVPNAWFIKTEDEQKGILRFLSRWLDNLMRGRLPGTISTTERDRLLFPITGGYDTEGRLIVGVPHEIPETVVALITLHLAKPLEVALSRNASLSRLKAGEVELEWAANAPADRDFTFVFDRLSSLLVSGGSNSEIEIEKDF